MYNLCFYIYFSFPFSNNNIKSVIKQIKPIVDAIIFEFEILCHGWSCQGAQAKSSIPVNN